MKPLLHLLLACFSLPAAAQFRELSIGVDGLTCSQCTRSVEMHLRKLDEVKDVRMDLEHTNGTVILDPAKKTDLKRLAKAVTDAGFSVRYLRLPFEFDQVHFSGADTCIVRDGITYQFVGMPAAELNGGHTVQVLDEAFLSRKELRRWVPLMKNKCRAPLRNLLFVTIVPPKVL